MAKKKRFEYHARNKEQMNKRANQSGGAFDSPIADDITTFTPKEGDYNLRFFPPTWDGADHYGLDVYIHYGVGADDQQYLCLQKMKNEDCPICEEKKKAEAAGDSEYAKELSATKRVAVWLIDRAQEDVGPLIWLMPWTIDRDFANLCMDKKSGEILLIDDPDDGYDVSFSREGSGVKTKYVGVAIDRKKSPLADDDEDLDDWLDKVVDRPLPDCLHFFDYNHIHGIFAGGASSKDEEVDEDDDDDEEEKPRRRTRQKPARKKASPKSNDDDDEEDDDDDEDVPLPDEDEEDDDEEEDEKPKKRARRRRPSKSKDDDDDEEVDDDEEDDDEEDDDRQKRLKRKAGRLARRKRRDD